MTDICDKAAEREEGWRSAGLAAVRQQAKPTEQPDEDGQGQRYCLSCAEVIASARLKAQPHAVRCTKCQSIYEDSLRHG